MQQDQLLSTATIREILYFSSCLRNPYTKNQSEHSARVENALQKLGLNHRANTQVGTYGKGGISGGEMRRVSIGQELVANVRVMFLDEPTSGLGILLHVECNPADIN